MKTQIGWDNEAQDWAWGDGLDQKIADGEIEERDRITMIKLCMDETESTLGIREKQKQQIARVPKCMKNRSGELVQPEPKDLPAIFLTKCNAHTHQTIKKCFTNEEYRHIMETVDVKTVLCIPEIWTVQLHPMIGIMIRAAERAGIENAELVSEPEAAAACVMEEHSDLEASNQGPWWQKVRKI